MAAAEDDSKDFDGAGGAGPAARPPWRQSLSRWSVCTPGPRTTTPTWRGGASVRSVPSPRQANLIAEELLDYAESDVLILLARTPLLGGVYPRRERPGGEYAHAANDARLAVLAEVGSGARA